MAKDNGVRYYITGETIERISFPNGEVVCKHCWPYLQTDPFLHRCRCRKTGEPIQDPEHEIGMQCPLVFKDREE